jgi:hypothetical protein
MGGRFALSTKNGIDSLGDKLDERIAQYGIILHSIDHHGQPVPVREEGVIGQR